MSTHSQLSENAIRVMVEANDLFARRQWADALGKYEGAIQLFNAALRHERLTQDKRQHLADYVCRSEELVRQMRARGVTTGPRTPAIPLPSAAEVQGQTSRHADPQERPTEQSSSSRSSVAREGAASPASDDLPDFAVPSGALPSSPVTPISPPHSNKLPMGAPSPPSAEAATNRSHAPPKPRPGGSTTPFAPATSNIVMKALELSEKLMREGRIKEAIDVVDHAFDRGSREEYNPGNFRKIGDVIIEMRRKFLKTYPPRLLQDNKITTQEFEVLRRSSQTQLMLLPMWDDISEGYPRENVYLPVAEGAWEDSFTPRLSPQQKERGARYVRLQALAEDPGQLRIVTTCDWMNIKQTLVGDCSLVCSLILCAALQQRFPSAKILSCIYPQDASGAPVVNRKGKYCVKLLINGTTRMVTIDDRLPVGGDGKTLLCSFSKDPHEMWVSLMEKAFVKVCGGSYDFPGSNSSNDLYMLSGWLPDFLAFDSEELDHNFEWKRLSTCHRRGQVLVTVNTPAKMEPDVAEKLGLITGHAYAVLDFREVAAGHRLVKIKNPWARKSWQGLFSLADERRCTAELLAELQFSEEEAEQGIFWMSWPDCVKFFSRCHLSWNPYLLFGGGVKLTKPKRLAIHGTYVHSESYTLCPQIHLQTNVPRATRFHVVLSRHITDVREYVSKDASGSGEAGLPLLAVHVYDVTLLPGIGYTGSPSRGRRIHSNILVEFPEGEAFKEPLHRGVYKNVAHQTVSFNCPAGPRDLALVVSQHKGTLGTAFNFSLTVHTELEANEDSPRKPPEVRLAALPSFLMPRVTRLKSAWNAGSSCGGRLGDATFVFNPQFRLILSEPSRMIARLIANQQNDAIQLYVVKIEDSAPGQDEGAGTEKLAPLPWAGRIDRLLRDRSAKSQSLCLHCPAYCHDVAVVDSTLPTCVYFDKLSQLTTPPPTTPPTAVAAEKAPVPPESAVHVSIKVIPPKELAATSTPLVVSFDIARGAPFIVAHAFLLSQRQLAAPCVTTMVVTGKEVRDFQIAVQHLLSPAAGSAAGELSAVALLKTEQLPRTMELSQLEPKLFAIAEDAVALFQNAAAEQQSGKSVMALNERLTQLLLSIDGVSAVTEEIKNTRKTFVSAAHAISALVMLCEERLRSTTKASPAPEAPSTRARPVPANALLPQGNYTLVASCWERGKPAPFELLLECDVEHTLSELPPEGHDFHVQTLQAKWAGTPQQYAELSFASPFFSRNPVVELTVDRKQTFFARMLIVTPPTSTDAGRCGHPQPLLAVFRRAGSLPDVVGSGQMGATVGPMVLVPGKYLMPVSATPAECAANLPFALKLYSSLPLVAKLLTSGAS